ncbi:MAG: HAMP domain-containing histidine kinase [Alphaproteobacteria bacterium]|nr:HAMP domain-containing histidine kinase [Alphaproteobacteria bacterium]
MRRLLEHLRHSLVWRTVVFANIASVTIVAAILGLSLRFADHRLEGLRDLTLWDQIDALRPALRITGDTVGLELPRALKALYDAPEGAARFAVATRDGVLRAASPGLDRPIVDPRSTALGSYFVYEDPATALVGRGVQVRLSEAPDLVLQVGQGPQHPDVFADSVMQELVEHFALALLIGLAVQIAVTTLTIRATLRPLARVADAAAAPPRRLPVAQTPIELKPVAATINALIDDLEGNLERERRFTADAAHQLRTPLARLEARISAGETPETARRLREPLDHLRTLVAGLLDAARIEAAGPAPDTPIDLADIARRVGAEFAPGAIERGVTLALGAAVPTRIRGDAMWIAQALGNVVANAIRHSPRGAVVDIDVPGDGSVAVRDRGPGIAAEDRTRVFERFWRGRDEPEPGAGIGLSITAAVMDRHGGSVRVEDAIGGGACFRLVFPRA